MEVLKIEQQQLPSSPGANNNVTDESDDPSTAALNDPTVISITATPSIEVTKTASVTDSSGDGKTGANDLISMIS